MPVLPSDRRRAGFTLIEALVAFAVIGGCLAVVLPLLAGGLRGTERAEASLDMLAVAESTLADAIGSAPPPLGTAEGTAPGGERWRLNVSAVASPLPGVRLVRYEVQVAGPASALDTGLRLWTVRLVAPEQP